MQRLSCEFDINPSLEGATLGGQTLINLGKYSFAILILTRLNSFEARFLGSPIVRTIPFMRDFRGQNFRFYFNGQAGRQAKAEKGYLIH